MKNPFLSPIARDYGAALVNPVDGPLIGIPVEPTLQTKVERAFCKGTFETGTLGFGFIVADPFSATANDVTCVVTSDPAYTLATISEGDVNANYFTSNATWPAAVVSATSVQHRIVAASLRITNITPSITKGGLMVGGMSPGHQNWNTNGLSTMLSYDDVDQLNADYNGWTTVLYRPAETEDFNFGYTYPATPQAGVQNFYLGLAVQAPAGNPQTYAWEFHVVHESQGAIVRGRVASLTDSVGASAIHTMAQITSAIRHPHRERPALMQAAFVSSADRFARHSQSHGGARVQVSKSPAEHAGDIWNTVVSGLKTGYGLYKEYAPAIKTAYDEFMGAEEAVDLLAL